MTSQEIAADIINNSRLFGDFIARTKNDVWKSFVALVAGNFDRITTEREFLDVVTDILDMAITVRTGNQLVDKVSNTVKGTAIGYIIRVIDKYCLDKWFGADWFDRLRAAAARLSNYSLAASDIDTLIDEDDVYAVHGS